MELEAGKVGPCNSGNEQARATLVPKVPRRESAAVEPPGNGLGETIHENQDKSGIKEGSTKDLGPSPRFLPSSTPNASTPTDLQCRPQRSPCGWCCGLCAEEAGAGCGLR